MTTVLHVAETLRGGPATIVRQLVRTQRERGDDVHVLCPREHADDLGGTSGIALHTFVRRARGLASCLRLAGRFAATVLRVRPQVVHLHSTFAGAICRPVLGLLRPFVTTSVVYSPHCWSFTSSRNAVAQRVYGLLEQRWAGLTDVIVCGSEFERAAAVERRIPGDLVLVPSAVEAPLGEPTEPQLSADGRVHLVFVGRYDQQKGVDVLLEAASRLDPRRFRFTVVGTFVRETGDLPDLEHVEYLPWQDRQGLAEIYRAATAVVMPSRWESFGLVAVEAMSYGKPVVASDCCSLPEIVQPGVNGWLVRTGDAADLVRVLSGLTLEDYRSTYAACLDTYRHRYSTGRMTHECDKAYAQARALARPRTNRRTRAPRVPSGVNNVEVGRHDVDLAS